MNVLKLVTGNLEREGGAMFTLPAFDPVAAPEAIAPRGSFARWHSRVRKLPEFAGELPVAALAEEMLTEGVGQINAGHTWRKPCAVHTQRPRTGSRAGRSRFHGRDRYLYQRDDPSRTHHPAADSTA